MVLSGEGSMRSLVDICILPMLQVLKNSMKNVSSELRTCIMLIVLEPTNPPWQGLEARVPFLDKQFLEVCMNINPEDKLIQPGKIEKYILRKAFDTSDEPDVKPYLPEEILWRQRNNFPMGLVIHGLMD